MSPSRVRRIARPRQIAMYLARQLTKMSYPQIGRRLGGRDHTTILHGNRKIIRMLRETNTMAFEVEGVREILQQLEPSKERARFLASRPLVETRI
jgi:chromosomal replication initiator protein